MRGAWLLLFPLIVHLAVLAGTVEVAAWVILVYLLVQLVSMQRVCAPVRMVLGCAVCVPFALLILYGTADWVLFALPVLVYGTLLKVFSDSLKPGHEPIATRFARALEDPPLGEPVLRYTRAVTRLWAVYFLTMLICSVLLAVLAPLWLWSWFANVAGYALTATLFVAEFLIRRRVLAGQVHPSVRGYFLKLSKCDYRSMMRR